MWALRVASTCGRISRLTRISSRSLSFEASQEGNYENSQLKAIRLLELAKLNGTVFEKDYSVAIQACATNRDAETAMKLYSELETQMRPSIISCTAVLSAFERRKNWKRALEFIEHLRSSGIEFDSTFYTTAISLCAKVSHQYLCIKISNFQSRHGSHCSRNCFFRKCFRKT